MDSIDSLQLPQWSIYREHTVTLGSNDYEVIARSGSLGEIKKLENGVYQYALNTPLDVEEGYIVGVSYNVAAGRFPLKLSFQDSGEIPVSYRRSFSLARMILDVREDTGDRRYLPLVTPIMGE